MHGSSYDRRRPHAAVERLRASPVARACANAHTTVSACVVLAFLFATTGLAWARSASHEIAEPVVDVDMVGDVDGTFPVVRKALFDTLWIADWTFDTGGPCELTGWEKIDNRIVNDGVQYWDLDPGFSGVGGISGTAAALGYEDDLCCAEPNGYDNNWYQAIRIEYAGGAPAAISFDYIVDSELDLDFLQVEVDRDCGSFDRVDYDINPAAGAAGYRGVRFTDSGPNVSGSVSFLELTDYGPGTHCVYIAFFADETESPCDGLLPTNIGKALVVDNITVSDANGTRFESFNDGTNDIGTFVNIQDSEPFGPTAPGRDGSWARAYLHVTDNDLCVENTTCSILWTDDVTPKVANDASMAFGPGGFVVRGWLDDIIVSPWVSLASTPNAPRTVIQFQRFPGNFFSTSRFVAQWSVRGMSAEPDGMGGSVACVSSWGHAFQWNSLSVFAWQTLQWEMTADFDVASSEIQIRHRVSDWQWIVGAPPPVCGYIPGPGPFTDRTRIGRIVVGGPVFDEGIDPRSQAQDAFPTEPHPGVTPGLGEPFRPTTDRFGTAAFSRATDLGPSVTPNLITGDSIWVQVVDKRDAGGVTSIEFHGSIVDGPHTGLAPPPHIVGANGFFVVTADSVRTPEGVVIDDTYFVDLDDDYFVGGDQMHYFWLASDALGGVASHPEGMSAVPASVEAAELATRGMLEVSFLPTISWDPDYLAAVAANNKVDPNSNPSFLDQSSQQHCILYVNRTNVRRRGGDLHRTAFMYTLDRMGYGSQYDVYDHQGMGNTNNHLGGRATVQQAQGYNLIVYDAGNTGPVGTIMPDGNDWEAERVDQAGWFRAWLAQAAISEAGWATLWIVATNALHEKPTNALYTTDMGVTLNAVGVDAQATFNPDCVGVASFDFVVGAGTNTVDFTTGVANDYSLNGGCPEIRHYDGLAAGGAAVEVYRYRNPLNGSEGDAAIVMNSNSAGRWNTIFQSHPWFDIRHAFREIPTTLTPEEDLWNKIANNVLPMDCGPMDDFTDVGEGPEVVVPASTALHPNTPNPFNPTTTIRFDLASPGLVQLHVYDAAGRRVRTLVDGTLRPDHHAIVWDGLDDAGTRVATGLYLYRLTTDDYTATRKMLVLR